MNFRWTWFAALTVSLMALGCAPQDDVTEDYVEPGTTTVVPEDDTDIIEEGDDIDTHIREDTHIEEDADAVIVPETEREETITIPEESAPAREPTLEPPAAEDADAKDEALPADEEPAVREEPAESLPEVEDEAPADEEKAPEDSEEE